MNTYKDRAFCSHSPQCSNVDCDRWFGDDHDRDARAYGLPVAFANLSLTCGKWKPVKGRAKLPAWLSEQERGLAP